MKRNFLSLVLVLIALAIGFTSCEKDDAPPTVKAQFEASSLAVAINETISFTNYSIGATSYEWNFGNGETSTEENPKHVYTSGGVYEVKLYAENAGVKDSIKKVVTVSEFSYIVNYGGYSGEKSTISLYDKVNDEITNGYYTLSNGTHMISNAQYAYNYMNKVFFMGNNLDQIYHVDANSFKQTSNGITEGVIKPRNCVGVDGILYVSCWGGTVWNDNSLSYIAKVDVATDAVIGKIALPGGPEGIAYANGKIYAALNYDKKIAVIDVATEAISYIETGASTSYFVKDNEDNLYVSIVSTYSNPTDQDGLGYINTSTDEFTRYPFAGVSSAYVNIMAANNDLSKIYLMTSAYDANWNLTGALAVFDTASKTFESNNFVEGILGINGVSVNSLSGNINVFVSPSSSQAGSVRVYKNDGTFVKELASGIAPMMMFDIK